MLKSVSSAGNCTVPTRIFAAAVLAAVAMMTTSPAVAGDTSSASAKATVLAGFQLQNTDPLQFGQVVPSGLGGSITIDAATGGVSTLGQLTSVGSNQTRARFTVKAPIGTVLVMAGDPSVQLTRSGGTETMTAALIYKGGSGTVGTLVLGLPIGLKATAADQEIFTGGTLNVAGNQAPGTYQGTFNLMVSYL